MRIAGSPDADALPVIEQIIIVRDVTNWIRDGVRGRRRRAGTLNYITLRAPPPPAPIADLDGARDP